MRNGRLEPGRVDVMLDGDAAGDRSKGDGGGDPQQPGGNPANPVDTKRPGGDSETRKPGADPNRPRDTGDRHDTGHETAAERQRRARERWERYERKVVHGMELQLAGMQQEVEALINETVAYMDSMMEASTGKTTGSDHRHD